METIPFYSQPIYSNKEMLKNEIVIQNLVANYLNRNVNQHKHYYELYKGNHAIINRVVVDTNKPNNKLVNDFYGYVIDTTVGYFLGNPISIQFGNPKVQEAVDFILDENYRDDLIMEVGKESCIKGHSAVLVFQNEESETKMLRVPAEKVLFVYDENNTIEVIGAIRFFTVSELDGANRTITKTYVEVYTDTDITYYFMTSSNEKKTTTIFLDTNKTQNPMPHIYGVVPLINFPNNEEEISDLAKIESLVDDYDRIISDSSNEQEAYRNAYLMIKNMVMNDDTLARLKQEGIIEVDEDGDVKFVTKDIQATAIQSHLDRVGSNIFKFAQTPDLSDEKFAGNLSGVAIKFKMFGLETKCIIKERKMNRAIKRLLKVLTVPVKVMTGITIDMSDVEIDFTRNLPANVTEIVDTVTKLNGIVDQETLLTLLPFIDNAKEIIDKLTLENDTYGKDVGNVFQNPDNFSSNDNKVIPNPNNDETILPYIANGLIQG